MVMLDRCISVFCIAALLNLSVGSVEPIIRGHLGVSDVSARWVVRMLMPEQKFTWKVTSLEMMTLFDEDSEEFLLKF